MRTSRKTDFRRLKISLVTVTYHSQGPQCPSLSPHVPLFFNHYAKSRDMTSERPLFWRAFVLPTFGPKVQGEATILQALKIAKIKVNSQRF